jgi:hypothetical protein
MKAETWVNSAALLDRLNFALALAAGKLPGVKVDNGDILPSAIAGKNVETVSAAADPEKELEMLEEALLAGKVSAQTHDSIRKQLNKVGPAKNVDFVLAEGLLLGSPEFQRR